MFLSSILCSLFKLPFENILKLKSTLLVKIHSCINRSWDIKILEKKKILFTILKEGKDFNMMSTATHFLSMLSAFIRRNIQLGHRLAPFTLRLSVIIMKVFQVTSSEICNIYALGTRPKKGSWCMTLCNILKRCVVTNVLFWIHFQYQKILAYDCVLICLKTILRTFLTSFKSNI